MTHPKIYLIRHGEKPPKVNGEDPIGLSTQGLARAQGLRKVFGASSPYNIGYIIAQHPKKNGGRARPYDTVLPLSIDLSLEINTTIDRDNAKKAAEVAKDFKGPGNVLICWEHGVLTDIVKEIGVKEKWVYPGARFDVIWAVERPWEELAVVGSEGIEGLDDKWVGGGGGFEGVVGPVLGEVGEVGEKEGGKVTVMEEGGEVLEG